MEDFTSARPPAQDYSKNTYDQAWSRDCWCAAVGPCRERLLQRHAAQVSAADPQHLCRWNKPVLVYGDDKLRKDHPVVAFLAREKRCASLGIYKAGCAPSTIRLKPTARTFGWLAARTKR